MFDKPHRAVDRVFVHCSASDNPDHDNVQTMREWHRARGWSDVGYHYFIRKSGQLEEGRPLSRSPAAQKNHNGGTIAICLHGLEEDKFTQMQFETLIALCTEINDAYEGRVTFHGHREVAAKSCPVFDYKRVLGLDNKGRLGSVEKGGVPHKPDATASRLLKKGDKGQDVRVLQTHLLDLGYDVGPVDGDFGPTTERAVFKFQTDNKLRVT